jgi:hypothetical protein
MAAQNAQWTILTAIGIYFIRALLNKNGLEFETLNIG